MGEAERQMGELKILPSIALQFESRWHARTDSWAQCVLDQ